MFMARADFAGMSNLPRILPQQMTGNSLWRGPKW